MWREPSVLGKKNVEIEMYETRLETNVRNEVENQCTKRG